MCVVFFRASSQYVASLLMCFSIASRRVCLCLCVLCSVAGHWCSVLATSSIYKITPFS